MDVERTAVLGNEHLTAEARERCGPALRAITLDGPSGVGKSTLGTALAEAIGWTFFDSGLVYRGLARVAIERDLDSCDTQALNLLAAELELNVDGGVLKSGCFAADELQHPAIAEFASSMATEPATRQVLTGRIQALIEGYSCVIAGRDAGTAISPEAPLRVFLSAPLDIRASRHAAQYGGSSLEAARGVQRRDQRDRTRAASPLQPALGAIILDTSMQTPRETIEKLCHLAARRNLT